VVALRVDLTRAAQAAHCTTTDVYDEVDSEGSEPGSLSLSFPSGSEPLDNFEVNLQDIT
jgi:hypothetical protein